MPHSRTEVNTSGLEFAHCDMLWRIGSSTVRESKKFAFYESVCPIGLSATLLLLVNAGAAHSILSSIRAVFGYIRTRRLPVVTGYFDSAKPT